MEETQIHDWIDPDTPDVWRKVHSPASGKQFHLVASEEFNQDGRSFGPGEDNFFEAVHKPDTTNESIQFYNSSTEFVTTMNGSLVLRTEARKARYWDIVHHRHGKAKIEAVTRNYTSAMVSTWNKFCFTGGLLELSIQLPGNATGGGLWPAAWLMGNLARATFEKSTMHTWPWSYDKCGEIPQLSAKQEINACTRNPNYGLHPMQGRGAPEIDIFEVMPGHEMPGLKDPVPPFMSNSLQVAPGISGPTRPVNGHPLNSSTTWYENLIIGPNSELNSGFWGQECGPHPDPSPKKIHKYLEDAISVNTYLSETHFQNTHTYKIDWQPGRGGHLYWFLDDQFVFGIDDHALEKATGAMIPVEPMYLILNTAISHRWGMPEPCPIHQCGACWRCYDCTNPDCQCSLPEGMRGCKNLPAEMKIDYIRLYQDPHDETHTLHCSPPKYPTAEFIKAHAERYASWEPAMPGTPPLNDVKDSHADSSSPVFSMDHKVMAISLLVFAGLLVAVWRLSHCIRRRTYLPIPEAPPSS